MKSRNVPNPNHKRWTNISGIPIPIFLRLIQRKNSKQETPFQSPDVQQIPQVKKWTEEDYKNYEDWQARSQALYEDSEARSRAREKQFQKQIKKIDKKSKEAQALRDEKWQEALEALENGSKKERAESVKKLDKLIDEFWDTL